ncbi:hypothetical protein PX554_04820 [Sphingomonas sp. H39-1-10]|uniref:hypothetical protein n=1 Tax=Sphingomonas pollutisoli TaxID=3030829 RepID=UPI0023B9C535|nr:hypothetical protein [Sphingomonas pollutisoli]MDF0487443.1 hypothetical protein [Sphingomonas pollutisoli]
MVASPRQRLILPIAPLGAGVTGAFIALLFLLMPTDALESLVVDSGVATLLDAARPPLGLTARAVLALSGGGAGALLAWIALFVAFGTRLVILNGSIANGDAVPPQRRADAHPDAPPRQPVFANRDLGTPFLDVRAEAPAAVPMGAARARPLPANLDVPLALFDPVSFAARTVPGPVEIPEPIREQRDTAPIPIRRDTADVLGLIAVSMRSAPPVRRAEAESPASIRALLDRLERSVAQRGTAPTPGRPDSIRDTLDTLRGLATRAG